LEKITVYEKPTCSTCKKTLKILTDNNVDFEKVNYYIKPFNKKQLKMLLKKMNMRPEELLRKNEAAYKELNMSNRVFTDDEFLNQMIDNPDLIQRPIVEMGDKAVLARPPGRINELFEKKLK
jgi:arsenate reductase (glutaredoxin)